jgi:hypothetical protein
VAFYTRVEPDPAVARAYVTLVETIALHRRAGRILEANAMAVVLRDMRTAYERHGVRAAVKADSFIKDRLRQTQVRPDSLGPHLRDKIVSRPLPTAVPAGAFGIADLDVLNTAVNPRTGGIYWRSQEFGLPVLPQRPASFSPARRGRTPPNSRCIRTSSR